MYLCSNNHKNSSHYCEESLLLILFSIIFYLIEFYIAFDIFLLVTSPATIGITANSNVIPQIDVFCDNGYTKEEMKVTNETRKILHLSDDVKIACTAVRVPVFRGHSESVDIEFEKELSPEEVRSILENAYGIKVVDNPAKFEYPTTRDAEYVDPVFVGRIRKSIAFDNGIALWCVADNLRIGAALNTVRICKKIIEMNLWGNKC